MRPGAAASAALAWAALGLSLCMGLVFTLHAQAAPLGTDDLFWHLRLGRLLLETGRFPAEEPFLFTSDGRAPIFHEWLFEILAGGWERLFGLFGLRALHLLLGLLSTGLVALWALRSTGSPRWALAICALFLATSLQRLVQLRPDLVSIAAFYGLLLLFDAREERLPVWRRVAVAAVGLVWANSHSLGPTVLPFLAASMAPDLLAARRSSAAVRRRLRDRAGALLLLCAAFCCNPAGPNALFFFVVGNRRNDLTQVLDDWSPFLPWRTHDFLPLSSPLVVAFVFGLAALLVACRLLPPSAPDALGDEARRRLDALWLGGLLALAAVFVAVRFVWMLPVPIACLALRLRQEPRAAAGGPLAAFASLGLLCATAAHLSLPGTRAYGWNGPPGAYLAWAIDRAKFHADAVDFLRAIGARGRVFGPYHLGGYLAHELYPGCRTFLDGRIEQYSMAVNRDAGLIEEGAPGLGERLARYGVDLLVTPVTPQSAWLRLKLDLLGYPLLWHDGQTTVHARPGALPALATGLSRTLGLPLPLRPDQLRARAEANLRRASAALPPGERDERALRLGLFDLASDAALTEALDGRDPVAEEGGGGGGGGGGSGAGLRGQGLFGLEAAEAARLPFPAALDREATERYLAARSRGFGLGGRLRRALAGFRAGVLRVDRPAGAAAEPFRQSLLAGLAARPGCRRLLAETSLAGAEVTAGGADFVQCEEAGIVRGYFVFGDRACCGDELELRLAREDPSRQTVVATRFSR